MRKTGTKNADRESIDRVADAVAATVEETTRGLHVERKWNNDWRAGTDLFLCYATFAHHVGIEFWRGSSIPDPTKLLEGTGKNLRHVEVRSTKEARAAALRRLIREAVRLDGASPRRTW